MKKIIASITLLVAVQVISHAQGTVNFANTATASTKIHTNSVDNGPATGLTVASAGNFYYALFYSSQAALSGSAVTGTNGSLAFNNLGTWSLDYMATNTGIAGRLAGVQNADGSVNVPGSAAGQTYSFVVLGWSAGIGSTLGDLQTWWNNGNPQTAGFIGQSAVANISLGGGAISPVTVFGTGVGQVPGFTLGLVTPVPEPTTMALAAMGVSSLLLFRRKK